MLSDRFNSALAYAEAAHRKQKRKGSDTPYVAHLLAVCAIVLEHGGDEGEAGSEHCSRRPNDRAGLETQFRAGVQEVRLGPLSEAGIA